MAELGAATIGVGAALGAAAYTVATGFVARHESNHSLQVTVIRQHIADFETAYEKGEVFEDDWQTYLTMRAEARKKESEYEESIEAYKETPMYKFITKWRSKREVRKKKKALRRANRSLRSHYYESTSAASDASSTTAVSGSPPRSWRFHSDEDDERILNWARDVANSDSDDELSSLPISRKESTGTRRQHTGVEQRKSDKLRTGYENTTIDSPAQEPSTSSSKLAQKKGRKICKIEDDELISERKPRKKWTPEETQMLVDGCSRHGVGNWKTILSDPTLKFNNRSPVDLKDRFRTYFPEAYKQHYPNAKTYLSSKVRSTLPGGFSLFEKTGSKKRRSFTEEEDEALKEGYEKHGTVWATIVKAPIFQKNNRRSTDLRDRFRNAFPELYQAAGYRSRKKLDPTATKDDSSAVRRKRKRTSQSPFRGGTNGNFSNELFPLSGFWGCTHHSNYAGDLISSTRTQPPPPDSLGSMLGAMHIPALSTFSDELLPSRGLWGFVHQSDCAGDLILGARPRIHRSPSPDSLDGMLGVMHTFALPGIDELSMNDQEAETSLPNVMEDASMMAKDGKPELAFDLNNLMDLN